MTGEILVGVDRSAPSLAALIWSAQRARIRGARLRIMNVIERSDGSGDSRCRELAWSLLNEDVALLRDLDADLVVAAEVAVGDPVEELAKASSTADLVVVGTHKTGFVRGAVYGSGFLALAVTAAHASAFIPEPSGRTRTGVVAGIDDSELGAEVIRFAADEASRTGQELILISSLPHGASRRIEHGAGPLGHNRDYMSQLAWAISVARKVNPQLPIRGRNTNQATAESLVRAATAAAVLVVGHGRAGSNGVVMLGSIELNVLLNISSPVIVLQGASVERGTDAPSAAAMAATSDREPVLSNHSPSTRQG